MVIAQPGRLNHNFGRCVSGRTDPWAKPKEVRCRWFTHGPDGRSHIRTHRTLGQTQRGVDADGVRPARTFKGTLARVAAHLGCQLVEVGGSQSVSLSQAPYPIALWDWARWRLAEGISPAASLGGDRLL